VREERGGERREWERERERERRGEAKYSVTGGTTSTTSGYLPQGSYHTHITIG